MNIVLIEFCVLGKWVWWDKQNSNVARGCITDLSPLVVANGFVWSWPHVNF